LKKPGRTVLQGHEYFGIKYVKTDIIRKLC